jgi:hypothetical protein
LLVFRVEEKKITENAMGQDIAQLTPRARIMLRFHSLSDPFFASAGINRNARSSSTASRICAFICLFERGARDPPQLIRWPHIPPSRRNSVLQQ